MTIDASRVGLTATIFAGALYLQGCAGLTSDESIGEPSAPVQTIEGPAPVTIERSTDPAETVRLIDRLDAAGCDFTGVEVTRGVHRKRSATIAILCRGL